MKTISNVLALVWLGLNALPAQTAQTNPSFEPAADGSIRYEEAERGPHHRVVATIRLETNELGEVTASTNSYTELTTCLHYREGDHWLPSEAKIEILPNNAGAAASKGQHKAIFPPEIKSGIIELQTPDNQWLRSRVWGLAYFDGTTAVLIAEVKESEGQVVGDNVVMYLNAFTDIQADIKYTVTLAGFEQDVVLRTQPPSPEQFGMNPRTTRLQVLTEFVEAPTPAKDIRQAGGLADQSLGFGQMSIGSGKAFSVDAEGDTTGQVPVAKEWTPLEGRDFLIEEVYYEKVAGQLQRLPVAGEYQGASLQRRGNGENVIVALKKNMPKRYAKATPKPGTKRMAQANPTSRPGFVMDYVTLTSQADFTFAGNTNYYVSGLVNLTGTTTIEGGTIVKFTNSTSAKISMSGQLICQTDPYRPAVLTSKNDNTVGETISGSTGNPSNASGGTYLYSSVSNPTNAIQYLRLSYAGTALAFDGLTNGVWHCQFVNCLNGVDSYNQNEIRLYNVLMAVSSNCIVNSTNIRGEHLTVDACSNLVSATGATLALTNSILTGVLASGVGSPTYEQVISAASGSGIYQVVGAASYYLADNSTNHNLGTTSINATLANDLASLTTYPPLLVASNFTVDTVLSPRAQRDTDVPDLGYHYDTLDWVVSGRTVSANLTLTGGVALGIYSVSSTYGLGLSSGSFVSEGTPTRLNWIVRYNTVQEQSTTNWSGTSMGASVRKISSSATVNARFTGWSLPSGTGEHFYDDTGNSTVSAFSHSQFGGGKFNVYPGSVGLTNCLWQRVYVYLKDMDGDPQWSLFNNLFYGGWLEYRATENPVLLAYDNLFDKTKITKGTSSQTFANNYNGYITGQNRLTPNGANDVILTSAPTYSTSTLGRWYLDSTTPTLLDVGSRTAPNATLYHFTQTTDQTKETTSQVDIGFHYVAADGNGSPVDTDGDGLADYYEDTNGNGSYAAGDLADWNSADTDGDGVSDGLEVTQGRNPLVAGTTSDSGALNLEVFTPLK